MNKTSIPSVDSSSRQWYLVDAENQTLELVKLLQKKYKLLKVNKFASGASFIFTNNKRDPKSEFTIGYSSGGIGGGYISYDGVKGQ